jgi:single-strand DNA-binding protein
MKWEKMMARKAVLEKDKESNESVNSVVLRGRVSCAGVEKILPSEDRVVEFRLVLHRESRPGVDVLDIGAWNSKTRRKALTLKIDEWVEIEGSIHRRFWQSNHGLASRWQIEASEITRI